VGPATCVAMMTEAPSAAGTEAVAGTGDAAGAGRSDAGSAGWLGVVGTAGLAEGDGFQARSVVFWVWLGVANAEFCVGEPLAGVVLCVWVAARFDTVVGAAGGVVCFAAVLDA